jgi:hypothetical protein
MAPHSFRIVDLVANPKRVASAIERERAARRGTPGWLGLIPRYKSQAVLAFGDGVVEVEVHPRSPAYRAGMRTGDVIKPINAGDVGQVPLENFDALRLPAGTPVGVEFFRPGATGHNADWLATYFKLARWPRTRRWETHPRVTPGHRVMKKDRTKFLAEMRRYLREIIPTRTFAWAYCYLDLLVRFHDNDDNPGVWPTYADSAKRLGISRRTVSDLAQMLKWFGVLKLLEGPTQERNSNLWEVCWPLRNEAARQPPPVPPPPLNEIRRVRL